MTLPDPSPSLPPVPAAAPISQRGLSWRVVLGTALAYALAGQSTLLLSIAPQYASLLFPSAGVALAAVITHGRAAWLGVLLGACIVNGIHVQHQSLTAAQAWLLAVVPSVGAMLQAGLGAALLSRFMPGPLQLSEPREAALFCGLGGLLACLLNATIGASTLWLSGVVPLDGLPFTWWTWWVGDSLGVLIGAPIALTLIGQPREHWVDRRFSVGLPLLVATVVLALVTVLVSRWDGDRSRRVFERDAATATASLQDQFRQAFFALEALRSLHLGSDAVTRDEMRQAAMPWLNLPVRIQAMGFSNWVPRTALSAFGAQWQADLGTPFKLVERSQLGQPPISAQDDQVLVIRHIEPLDANRPALGVNAMAVPAAREAILRSARQDVPVATEGFRLAQEVGDQSGVVIYRALYRGQPTEAQRMQALRGVVFVTLRMQQSTAAALADAPPYLRWCLLENPSGSAAPRRLAGHAACEVADKDPGPALLQHESTLVMGDRQWRLRLSADRQDVPEVGQGSAWLFSSVCLLSVGMLTVLLLASSGRTQRIEAAVTARTADLRREMHERARTEIALRESEQRFRNIFDHAPIGILYADLQGRMRETNPRIRELLGYASDELAQRSLADLAHPDHRTQIERGMAQLLAGEVLEIRHQIRLQHRGGQALWAQTNWSVLRDPSGQPQRLVGVIEDITDHLRRQEAEQGRQLAESANRAKSEFLSRMSHELRTPLNAMLGFAQLLSLDRQAPLADRQRPWVTQILQSGWHLLEMINDTLDLSRIEAGMLRLQSGPVLLEPVIRHSLAMIESAALDRQISVQVDLAAAATHVQADETRLKQVLTNLLSNAVKYNVTGGQVKLATHLTDAGQIQILVQDTGPGLSVEQMSQLFQPFNRLGREDGGIEGTGIGLVISRGLAELMGGSLHARSAPGQGATFVLTLATAAPGQSPAAAPLVPPPAQPIHASLVRVHYVEDNETNVEVMRGMLAQRSQVEMTVSTGGRQALQDIRTAAPDLVLLDMHLPDLDGLDVLAALKADARLRDLPVVVVSADATAERRRQALAAGAARYLTKPVNLAELLAALDEVSPGQPQGSSQNS